MEGNAVVKSSTKDIDLRNAPNDAFRMHHLSVRLGWGDGTVAGF